MKIAGGCHCRDIAYEAEINPDNVTTCHCTDCQRMSGTAFRTVIPARAEDFQLTRGAGRWAGAQARSLEALRTPLGGGPGC